MLKSMTAFGRARRMSDDGSRDITIELKSVNSRYLDCTVRLPRAFSYLEEKIKAYVSDRGVVRGKLEIYVSIDVLENNGMCVDLDTAAAESYIAALKKLRDEFGLKDDISVMRVAANRDLFIVKKPDDDAEKDWNDIRPTLDEALGAFIAAREREGANLEADIYKKIDNIKANLKNIAALSDADTKGYYSKLQARIKQFLSDNDIEIAEQRILTEAAIFADRVAIDEEIVRLESHFKAFDEIIATPEPAGRKLDFLLQEMNRETNTIGSKANDAAIAKLVVANKNELEKIREQIQNIE